MACQPPKKYASRFANFVGKLSSPPGELQEFTARRQQAARRPLGAIVGEFGRKDMTHFWKNPAGVILVIGLVALLFFFLHWMKWWGFLFLTGLIAPLCFFLC